MTLYVVQNRKLHIVDPNTGKWRVLGTRLWDRIARVDDHLVALFWGRLYRVERGTGEASWRSTREWAPRPIIGLGNSAYSVQLDNRLWRIDPNTGDGDVVGNSTWDTKMTTLGSELILMRQSRFCRVSPESGAIPFESAAEWAGTSAICCHNRELYIIQEGRLHRVNPMTGQYAVIGNDWSGEAQMVSADHDLMIFQNSRLHIVEASGSYRVVGNAEWSGSISAVYFHD